MTEPNPYAGDPYDRLGIDSDASPTEVKMAAAKAKKKYNPDRADPDEKSEIRELLYRIRDAEEAILEDREPEYGAKPRPDGVKLSIEPDIDDPVKGDTITFEVSDSDGSPVSDASVSFAGNTKSTDDRGLVDFVAEKSGTFDAKVMKSGIFPTYIPSTVTIEVDNHTPELSIEAGDTTVPPHTDVELVVNAESDESVEGAIITGEGIDTETGSDGTATINFDTEGKFEVSANKKGYEADSTQFIVEKRVEQIKLDYSPTEPYVGDTISFSVSAKGSPDITIEFNGESKSIEAGTTTDFVANSVGTFSAEAVAPDTKDTIYKGTSERINVSPKPLDIAAEALTVPTGESTRIEVKESHTGNPADGVLVSTSNEKEDWTTEGTVHLEFHEPGEVEITAGTASKAYERTSTRIEVVPSEIELTVEVGREKAEPGEEIKVTVRDTYGDRVEDAEIEMAGETWKTDKRGNARIQTEEEGHYTLSATKDGDVTSFGTAKKEIRIGDPNKLSVNSNKDSITSGDSVTFTVVNDSTGAPVSGARLEAKHSFTDEYTTCETDEDGKYSMTFDEGGLVRVKASKVIEGIEENSQEAKITVERTNTGRDDSGTWIGISTDRIKNMLAKGMMVVALVSLIGGIGAVIIQGIAAAWILGVAVVISILSSVGYTQILS